MNIGEKIRNIRKSKNMSVDHIANALNISKFTYYKYENGQIKDIPLSQLEKIANILYVSLNDIFGIEKKMIRIYDSTINDFKDVEVEDSIDNPKFFTPLDQINFYLKNKKNKELANIFSFLKKIEKLDNEQLEKVKEYIEFLENKKSSSTPK